MVAATSVEERFFTKVEFTEACWLWRGAITNRGYGNFIEHGQNVGAHRWAYEFCVGPIPSGMELDHLCRQPFCVRPDHLEPECSAEWEPVPW